MVELTLEPIEKINDYAGEYTNDVKYEDETELEEAMAESIRDIGNGIEVIPHYDAPIIGYSYSYDTVTTCDTKSILKACNRQGYSHDRLFRSKDDRSILSSSTFNNGIDISTIPSLH